MSWMALSARFLYLGNRKQVPSVALRLSALCRWTWTFRYVIRVEMSDWPSSSDSMSSSWRLVLSTRKLSVPTMETTIRDRNTFFLLSSARGRLKHESSHYQHST